MPSSITLKSYAKVNLSLQVMGKRNDGFHNIVTIFERINLFDTIKLTKNTTGVIDVYCDHPDVPSGPKNLVYKVAKLMKDKFKVSEGVRIDITKRIPVAAGLAGGSTNAATAILGLNKLWNLELSKANMVSLAAQIGSDVPFFIYDVSWALGTGRGEEIKPLSIATKLSHVLIVPKYKIYAKDAYQRLNLRLTKKNDSVNILIPLLRKNQLNDLGSSIFNDLESSIVLIRPSLLKLKQKLQAQHVVGTIFSGSGPAIFSLTQTLPQAKKLARQMSQTYSQVYVVNTI